MTSFHYFRFVLFDGVVMRATRIFIPLPIPPWAVVACEQFKSEWRRECLWTEILAVAFFNYLLEPVRF